MSLIIKEAEISSNYAKIVYKCTFKSDAKAIDGIMQEVYSIFHDSDSFCKEENTDKWHQLILKDFDDEITLEIKVLKDYGN